MRLLTADVRNSPVRAASVLDAKFLLGFAAKLKLAKFKAVRCKHDVTAYEARDLKLDFRKKWFVDGNRYCGTPGTSTASAQP